MQAQAQLCNVRFKNAKTILKSSSAAVPGRQGAYSSRQWIPALPSCHFSK